VPAFSHSSTRWPRWTGTRTHMHWRYMMSHETRWPAPRSSLLSWRHQDTKVPTAAVGAPSGGRGYGRAVSCPYRTFVIVYGHRPRCALLEAMVLTQVTTMAFFVPPTGIGHAGVPAHRQLRDRSDVDYGCD